MKHLLIAAVAGFFLVSCTNGATDGKANTDTTNFTPDTNLTKDGTDHVNRNFGTVPTDTSRRPDSMKR
jgi:hypothetical protein